MRSMTIDVGPLEAELLERALAVLDPLDVVAGMPEVRAHRACDDAVVLDEQYACHMRDRVPRRAVARAAAGAAAQADVL